MPYSEISSRVETNYTVHVDGLSDIGEVKILQRVCTEDETCKVSYVINCNSPYLSIDCDEIGISKIMKILDYIVKNPVIKSTETVHSEPVSTQTSEPAPTQPIEPTPIEPTPAETTDPSLDTTPSGPSV